jgi:hypothetical protein
MAYRDWNSSMIYVRRMLLLAGMLGLLAGCGSPAAPDLVTPSLQSLLRAGSAVSTAQTGPAAATAVTDLSVTPDGSRIALEYGDGHVVVWDVPQRRRLLSTPPQQTEQIWLTGAGNMLAMQVGSVISGHQELELWEVNQPGKGSHFSVFADWAWVDPTLSHMLVIPNFTETCPGLSSGACHGIPGLIWDDLQHSRLIASSPSPPSAPTTEPNGKQEPQPPNLVPLDTEYDQADGTFAIASSAQNGFVAWKPGSAPVETDAQCQDDEALAGDGQLFACISAPADALTLWNVKQRRMVRQMLLPDFVLNNQQTTIAAVTFADNDSVLAVAVARQSQSDLIRIYRVSDFQLVQTLTLGTSAGQDTQISLWPAGRSLIAEQKTGPTSAVYYAFPLGP